MEAVGVGFGGHDFGEGSGDASAGFEFGVRFVDAGGGVLKRAGDADESAIGRGDEVGRGCSLPSASTSTTVPSD